jgi:hypothetical protein
MEFSHALLFDRPARKALSPSDFDSREALSERLLAFGAYYREIARPFEGNSTRQALARVLVKIAARQPQPPVAA